MEIYLERYKVDISVHEKDHLFSYEYQYMSKNFSGDIIIRATRDEIWIAEIIKMRVEDEIEQFILDELARILIRDQMC